MLLRNKVALITGGASGIGKAIVEKLASEGATVCFIDRDVENGSILANRVPNANFIEADLADPIAIQSTVEQCLSSHNQIDIVVNNAGVILPKSIEDISPQEWDWLMSINLRAPFLLVQAALPALKEQKGNILNISSTAALHVFGDNIPYISAKAGLIAMTKAMALDFHAFGIRVNCICPGAVHTPLLDQDIELRHGNREEVLNSLDEKRILVQPESIADTALHLVSDSGSALTGSILVVDAGASLF
jgi:3-hydroxybutyrate dehydrogenase